MIKNYLSNEMVLYLIIHTSFQHIFNTFKNLWGIVHQGLVYWKRNPIHFQLRKQIENNINLKINLNLIKTLNNNPKEKCSTVNYHYHKTEKQAGSELQTHELHNDPGQMSYQNKPSGTPTYPLPYQYHTLVLPLFI